MLINHSLTKKYNELFIPTAHSQYFDGFPYWLLSIGCFSLYDDIDNTLFHYVHVVVSIFTIFKLMYVEYCFPSNNKKIIIKYSTNGSECVCSSPAVSDSPSQEYIKVQC